MKHRKAGKVMHCTNKTKANKHGSNKMSSQNVRPDEIKMLQGTKAR